MVLVVYKSDQDIQQIMRKAIKISFLNWKETNIYKKKA